MRRATRAACTRDPTAAAVLCGRVRRRVERRGDGASVPPLPAAAARATAVSAEQRSRARRRLRGGQRAARVRGAAADADGAAPRQLMRSGCAEPHGELQPRPKIPAGRRPSALPAPRKTAFPCGFPRIPCPFPGRRSMTPVRLQLQLVLPPYSCFGRRKTPAAPVAGSTRPPSWLTRHIFRSCGRYNLAYPRVCPVVFLTF